MQVVSQEAFEDWNLKPFVISRISRLVLLSKIAGMDVPAAIDNWECITLPHLKSYFYQ